MSSLLFFGLPALGLVVGFWVAMPWFVRLGMLPYHAYLLAVGVPLALMLVVSLPWLRLEGREIRWSTVRSRLRLHRMSRNAWVWSVGALIAGSVVGAVLFGWMSRFLIEVGVIPVPDTIPAFVSPNSLTDPVRAIPGHPLGGFGQTGKQELGSGARRAVWAVPGLCRAYRSRQGECRRILGPSTNV